MKSSYPDTFDFYTAVLSVFDIGAALPKKNITSLRDGLNFDMQQLSHDQVVLTSDYKKVTDKLMQEDFGDSFE